MIFAAIITDRGLLATQTRDVGMCGNQSFIVTRLCYMTTPLPKERHEECRQEALDRTRPIGDAFREKASKYNEKFGTLLDAAYLERPRGACFIIWFTFLIVTN